MVNENDSKLPDGVIPTLASGDLIFAAAAGSGDAAASMCRMLAQHCYNQNDELGAIHHARNLLLLGAKQLQLVIDRWAEVEGEEKFRPTSDGDEINSRISAIETKLSGKGLA